MLGRAFPGATIRRRLWIVWVAVILAFAGWWAGNDFIAYSYGPNVKLYVGPVMVLVGLIVALVGLASIYRPLSQLARPDSDVPPG